MENNKSTSPSIFTGELSNFKSLDAVAKYNMMLESLSDYYCGDIPLEVSEKFIKDTSLKYDMVLENLQTHDFTKLINALIKYTPYIFNEFPDTNNFTDYIYKSENGKNAFKLTLKDAKLIKDQDVVDILNFFNYYASQELSDNKSVVICPTFPENRTNYIMNECHGIVYHITYKNKSDYILKNGIRCKALTDRIYPKRIYVFAVDDFSKVNSSVDELLRQLKVDKNSVDLLKITLPPHGDIPFYDDDAMISNDMFFTYTFIPPQFIEKIW